MSKKLFLLDGMALVYRSYFAFMRNPMINSKGKNVSAVFGFINALLEIIDRKRGQKRGQSTSLKKRGQSYELMFFLLACFPSAKFPLL